MNSMIKDVSLREIVKVFLKLGMTGFGGPAAHIAMMRTEVVEKRNWLSEREFLDLIGAANMIPGPNSTELAIFIGFHLKKWPGLILSGLCFILPAFFIVLGLAILYAQYGALPDTTSILIGMRPVIVAIVLVAMWKFGKTAIINYQTAFILILAYVMSWLGLHELTIIFGLGFFQVITQIYSSKKLSLSPELFLFFLKVGSVLFGSGYVLIAYLQKGLVEKNWITQNQLLDAITIGQVTPGPVFTTATFIGYSIDGVSGAIISTLGIFLPSFLFVALLSPLIPRMRSSVFFSNFIDGVNAASIGLMIYILLQLAQKSLTGFPTFLIGSLSLFVLINFSKVNSVYLIILGAVLGFFYL